MYSSWKIWVGDSPGCNQGRLQNSPAVVGFSCFSAAQSVIGLNLALPHTRIPPKENLVMYTRYVERTWFSALPLVAVVVHSEQHAKSLAQIERVLACFEASMYVQSKAKNGHHYLSKLKRTGSAVCDSSSRGNVILRVSRQWSGARSIIVLWCWRSRDPWPTVYLL